MDFRSAARRTSLTVAALALPLSLAPSTSPVHASPSPVHTAAADDAWGEAQEAERAAEQARVVAVQARDVAAEKKQARDTAFADAKMTREVVDLTRANLDRLKGVRKARRAHVNKVRAQVKKNRTRLARAKKKPPARARLKASRERLRVARQRLRLTRNRADAAREQLKVAGRDNHDAWTVWGLAKRDFDAAKAHAAEMEAEAAYAEERARRLWGEVAVVDQATVSVLPQIHDASAETASASSAKHLVAVRAVPAAAHLRVDVQHKQGSAWVDVAQARTRDDGRVEVPVANPGQYRAVVNGTVSNVAAQDRKLIFSDEFSGSTMGNVWSNRMQMHRPWAGLTCAKGDPAAVTHTPDTMRLWVKKDTAAKGTCPITLNGKRRQHSWRLNGHVSTQDSFSFTYGVAAARLKFHDAKEGQHAAFWMQPQSHSGLGRGPKHWGAEIDVVEFFGQKWYGYSGVQHSTYHTDEAGVFTKDGGLLPDVSQFLADKDDKWFNRYHVFSVEWTPTEYIFRIDGQESYRSSVGVSGRPQFLILSMLSSDYSVAMAADDGERDLGTQRMDVDWVRVWQ